MKVIYSTIALIFWTSVGLVCAGQQEPNTLSVSPQTAAIFASYPNLEAQVREYGAAYIRRDNQRLMELTCPKMFEAAGGKEIYLREIVKGEEQLQAEGEQYLSWTPADVTRLLSDSGSLYAVIPTIIRMKRREQRANMDVCLIGVSNDQGQNWTFVSASCVRLKDAFPEVAGKLILCPKKDSAKLTKL